MAANDDPPGAGPGDGQDDGQDGSTSARLDALEGKVDALVTAVGKLVPSSRADAQRREEDRLDRPSRIAELVQAELTRRDKERADRETADAEQAERARDRERLAKLEEHPPAPPVRRSTRFMWGAE